MTGAARHRTSPPVGEQDVLSAVLELSGDYRAPSTSLITWHLAGGGMVTSAFQSAVRAALERLRASGQVSCVVPRYQSLERDPRQRDAVAMTRRRGTTWSRGLIVAVGLTYATVIGVFFAAGYLMSRLLL